MTDVGVAPPLPQVFELGAGITSEAVWREVSLLRCCCHPRIVPVHGVAIKARGERGGVRGGMQQHHLGGALSALGQGSDTRDKK